MARILLVEDNKLSQKMMYYTFKKYGIEADFADDGLQADKMARAETYDIILMDIIMPNMDGYQATQYIREAEKQTKHHALIIGLSGNVYDSEREKCLKAGMDDFMTKPFNIDSLRSIAKSYMIKI